MSETFVRVPSVNDLLAPPARRVVVHQVNENMRKILPGWPSDAHIVARTELALAAQRDAAPPCRRSSSKPLAASNYAERMRDICTQYSLIGPSATLAGVAAALTLL